MQTLHNFQLAPAPARPAVKTGPDAAALFQAARQIVANGHVSLCRVTAEIKGERFTCWIHSAKHRSGETYHVASYVSRTIEGHVRQIVIGPDGRAWMLFADGEDGEAKAIFNRSKYLASLRQIAKERESAGGRRTSH